MKLHAEIATKIIEPNCKCDEISSCNGVESVVDLPLGIVASKTALFEGR